MWYPTVFLICQYVMSFFLLFGIKKSFVADIVVILLVYPEPRREGNGQIFLPSQVFMF